MTVIIFNVSGKPKSKRPFERVAEAKLDLGNIQKTILEGELENKKKQWLFEEEERKQHQERWEFENEERNHKREVWALEKLLLKSKLKMVQNKDD